MKFFKSFTKDIFSLNATGLERAALKLFHYQALHNLVYKQYLEHLNIVPEKVRSIASIPFLPISFFKSHQVVTGAWQPEKIFESSGTTGQQNSRHYVYSLDHYHQVCMRNFELFFGPVSNYHVFALLPSYL
ncbi:MAG: acyl transferase, partial [Cyclobacteriaceae bacterium]